MRWARSDTSGSFTGWLRVQFFRVWTALATFALLVLCFFYRPEWLTWWQRATMKTIETGSGLLPYPWGDQTEVALRALGGSIWFQIAAAIILFRVVMWLIGAGGRSLISRRRSRPEDF
jgi:hypothetical protein